ncbi:glycosyltransferase [Winogradskyella maritima]|uniref:Glycosyltransferase n=1 Tax=Winogradskyella maritima TaxID=1517766 RepID=A0ABV8AGQ8_9FLAO|nr:glycosyltransferase [Winogradskyella maritima]
MQHRSYSFVIPVYNRPNEVFELLESFQNLEGNFDYEIVIIEDGSAEKSDAIIAKFPELNVSYFFKENSGPGDSRNYGMAHAKGNYFIILDSDVLLPPQYLKTVDDFLSQNFVHCFGGPDAAHPSFSNLQKAINFAMTSFLTTGGIRGGTQQLEKFQPRSFNMGLSKEAFETTKGFGKIHPGEDPDLTLRLWALGYKTALIENAFVYHKRRISWSKFKTQVHKFGMTRPILNHWHPSSKKLIFWLPTCFILGFFISILLLVFGFKWPLLVYAFYSLVVLLTAFFKTKSILIALQSTIAVFIMFYGYGIGFLKSSLKLWLSNKTPEELFAKLFFK